MAKQLTPVKKKRIIAEYLECGSYAATAKKCGVSPNTVKNVVRKDPAFAETCAQKKEQMSADILEYMEEKNKSVKKFINYVLDIRLNPDTNKKELDALSIPHLATVFGVTVDKALKAKELKLRTGTDAPIEDTNAVTEEVDRDG